MAYPIENAQLSETMGDLSSVPNLSDEKIVEILQTKFLNYSMYTNVGASNLIAVNPFKQLAQNDAQTSDDYVTLYKNASPDNPVSHNLDPHIFELANRAYFHMRRTGNDQAIFLCGKSGGGKSELANLTLRHLLRLGSNKKKSKLQAQLINSLKILHAFGSARTPSNDKAASRFGLYTETHYTERGKVVGAKILHYFLEKSRLTATKQNESNFNIFYWLIAGTEPDEKQVLQLSEDPRAFRYLERYGRPLQPSDSKDYNDLKSAMRIAGFKREHFGRIIQVLAAILHLGNVEFSAPDGVGEEETVIVTNPETLDIVADFLGVEYRSIETVLKYKTAVIGKDMTTLILDTQQAEAQRDELAEILYSLTFSWMVEHINQKIYTDNFNSFIGVLDFPGTQPSGFSSVGFEQFCMNYANERMFNFVMDRTFKSNDEELRLEMIPVMTDILSHNSNDACIDLFDRPSRGICAILNKMSEKAISGKRVFSDINAVDAIEKYNASNPALAPKTSDTGVRQFAIQHFAGEVTYDPIGFITKNNSQLQIDFISLFRGNSDMPPSWSQFVLELFSDNNLAIDSHPILHGASSLIATTQQNAKPTRLPSMRKSKRGHNNKKEETKEEAADRTKKTVLSQIQSSLDDLVSSFEEAMIWSIFCIQPNTTENYTHFDKLAVFSQVKSFQLKSLAMKMKNFYIISLSHQDFLSRYAVPLANVGLNHDGTLQEQCEAARVLMQWNESGMAIGVNKVLLNYESWRYLEEVLRKLEKQEKKNSKVTEKNADVAHILNNEEVVGVQVRNNPMADETEFDPPLNTESYPLPSVAEFSRHSYYSNDDFQNQRSFSSHSVVGSVYHQSHYTESRMSRPYLSQDDFRMNDSFSPQQQSLTEDIDATDEKPSPMTPTRKRWLAFVWAVTFWIPNIFLIKCGRMKRKDVRIAWREKFALCAIIVFMCAFVIWFLVFFGDTICPGQDIFTVSELASHNSEKDGYVAINGEVFNLGNFAPHHYPNLVPTSAVLSYAGTDASDLFPLQVSDLCEGVSPYVSLDYQRNYTDSNAQYHDFRYSSGNYVKNWYYDQISMLRRNYKVGDMATDWKGIADQAKGAYKLNGESINRNWAVINNCIYDLTTYILGGRYLMAPPGETIPENISVNFLDSSVVNLFMQNAGTDITHLFETLPLTNGQKERELVCLRNLYFKGLVDERNSTKCQFSTYFLLAVTICLCLVIFFKFVAAIRIGGTRIPEELDKFVICQVTCYTEDESSLRKTIDSLATSHYDDKRKLILVICDGMIIGSGNDRPTPRIVLDIFGVNPQVDPEALSFISVGEGAKQHNRAKIYSGLYEIGGHVVPYLVVAKVGAPNERQKPGNRGKRDSQLILMQFLNRVQYDAPMNPMQLEMYHQMRNVIGVSPEMYEFILMVDADTEVMTDGINHLVSSMAHDAKIIGICGETTLSNEKDTWVTMIQVYEYFISHHMVKSFESLFSTVSCLPGCFTMYRIRTVDGKRPILASNEIIEDYKINVVDTLHKKNLLYLGEDRYLTTLLLKHFTNYKTKFNPDAKCKTNAPDTWNVLISQRRRWINSTVHNLGELVFLPGLCGFCCFSMRFVVMLDLISTLVQPALLGYLGFLIYKLYEAKNQIPYITIITLGCTYGLQIILFIMNGRWEYIAWFFLSILALPVFSFWIPVYSYWHFDDFSWGNTRVVVGEKGKKMAVSDEGEFDPKSIPLMTWSQYEKMMLSDHYSDGFSQGSTPLGPISVRNSPYGSAEFSTYGGHPPSAYGGPPASTFGGPPASTFGGPPASTFGGQPPSAYGGHPASIYGGQAPSAYGWN